MDAASEELTPAETVEAALPLSESSHAASLALGDASLAQQSTIILNQSLERHVDGRNVIPRQHAKPVLVNPQNRKRGGEPSSTEASNKRLKQLHDGTADRMRSAKLPRPTRMIQGATKQHGDEVYDLPDDSPDDSLVENAQLAVSKDKQSVHPRVRTAESKNQEVNSVNGGMEDQLITASENGEDVPRPDQAVRRKRGRPKANKASSTVEPNNAKPQERTSTQERQLRSSSTILNLPDWSKKSEYRPTKLWKVQLTQTDGTKDELAGTEGQDEHGGDADKEEQQLSEVQSQGHRTGVGSDVPVRIREDKLGSPEPRSNVESEDVVHNAAGIVDADDGDQDLDEDIHNEDTSESLSANIELFGQRDTWKRTIKAAEKVRKSRTGTRPSSTKTRRFFSHLEEGKKIYKALGAKDKMHERPTQHDPAHLNQIINGLESEVHGLRSTDAGPRKKVKLLLDDIYVYGVPDLVILLGDAMVARTELYSAIDDCQALEEILKLQDITIALCTAAKQWRTTPKIGGVSFVKETERQIFPYLRDIRRAFQNELDVRYDKLRQVRQTEVRERKRLEAIEQTRRSRQELIEIIEEKRCKTYADMLRNESDMKMFLGTRSKTRLSISPAPKRKFLTADSWTKEQDRELVHQLRLLRHLPGNYLILRHQAT